ncbi:MAG: geranylgeranylglyceryl/heptaprenylglyceryl phosphate synthase [Promethearchaeota archaeon]|nr:MAG: geranylgeranylglyceryl/heptaprenylglyceryl phosphate synthase [Candidatus Lokiarchaeota archaeon]
MFNNSKKNGVYSYLIEKINSDGALHFSLIDPDPLQQNPRKAAKMAKYCEDVGSDAILVGGSTIINQEFVSKTINKIKREVNIPIIIFPGGMTNFSAKADAILFMSLLNSKDPYFIVGQQALASYPIKVSGLEHISMAYLIIEPGATAGWVGNAKLLPRKKPKLTAAYALTAEMYGFKMVYLEAGSGGNRIPPSHISLTSRVVSIPVIAGGGVRTKEDARTFVESGADIVVMGTFIEDNVLKDEGKSLKPIIDEIKATGNELDKNYKII